MALINWSDSFSVNVAAIDTQHKRLVDMVNRLHDAMLAGKGNDVVYRVLVDLVDYTKTHFATEERLLTDNKYVGFAKHKAEHDALTKQVLDLQQQVKDKQAFVTSKTSQFLKDWLTNHIMKVDREYSAFLNSKGVH